MAGTSPARSTERLPSAEPATLISVAQVEGFRPREHCVADLRERGAAARILDTGPGERRIEIIATVHVDGAGLDPVADGFGGVRVARPDRGRQAIRAVVHERDRLLV